MDDEAGPVMIGKPGRRICAEQALDHIAGYFRVNVRTVRPYQLCNPQWTMGKNFDGTGSFGP
jgi:2-keto-4-pentenoate hydratase/2-oxohepta-3-ene-1,7-dioic acid hydratase in catechol pathway